MAVLTLGVRLMRALTTQPTPCSSAAVGGSKATAVGRQLRMATTAQQGGTGGGYSGGGGGGYSGGGGGGGTGGGYSGGGGGGGYQGGGGGGGYQGGGGGGGYQGGGGGGSPSSTFQRPGGYGGGGGYAGRGGGGGGGSTFFGGRGGGRGRGGRGRGRGRGEGIQRTVPMNEEIQCAEVRLLGEEKEAMGVFSLAEALAIAREAGVDLIMVVPDAAPPVCRLIDYSKFNYELVKAAKDAKKKQREAIIETKEVKMRPGTDVHDYQTKVRAATKFIAKGARVKLTVQFKGREMEFKDIGRELFNRFVEDLGGDAVISVEQPAQMQGRQMTMVLGPKKELP